MWQQVKTPVEHSWEEDIDFLLTQAAGWLPAAAGKLCLHHTLSSNKWVILGT